MLFLDDEMAIRRIYEIKILFRLLRRSFFKPELFYKDLLYYYSLYGIFFNFEAFFIVMLLVKKLRFRLHR